MSSVFATVRREMARGPGPDILRLCSAACPACFGVSDAPMAVGMNAGIFVLLGVTAVVLAAVGGFGVMLARRARAIDVTLSSAVQPSAGGS